MHASINTTSLLEAINMYRKKTKKKQCLVYIKILSKRIALYTDSWLLINARQYQRGNHINVRKYRMCNHKWTIQRN